MAYNAPPPKNTKYKNGYYRLTETTKYLGDPNHIVFRSGLEFKLCRYLDSSLKVRKWGSEIISIPYKRPSVDKNGLIIYTDHTYHIDFYAEIINTDTINGIEKLLIEVKPHKEYLQVLNNKIPDRPKEPITKKKLDSWAYAINEFNKNKHKWAYAQDWCKQKGYKFLVVTEEILNRLP